MDNFNNEWSCFQASKMVPNFKLMFLQCEQLYKLMNVIKSICLGLWTCPKQCAKQWCDLVEWTINWDVWKPETRHKKWIISIMDEAVFKHLKWCLMFRLTFLQCARLYKRMNVLLASQKYLFGSVDMYEAICETMVWSRSN